MLASDGLFYGTTQTGGATSDGTIFRLAPTTPGDYAGAYTLTVLATFTGYSATATPTEGQTPRGSLTERSDGGVPHLYGVLTTTGTSSTGGRVFKFPLPAAAATSVTVLPVATFPADYRGPSAGLVKAPDGTLYGTTSVNTGSRYGAVYRISTAGVMSLVRYFDTTSGTQTFYPFSPLVVGQDGFLYGGTDNSGGAVFRMNPANGQETTLVTMTRYFGAAPGWSPYGIVQQPDGSLICLAQSGGRHGGGGDSGGVLFKLTGSSIGPWTYTGLWEMGTHFPDNAGENPVSGLVSDGTLLYGTTQHGGLVGNADSGANGSIYSLNPVTKAIQTLHVFTDTSVFADNTGFWPMGSLLRRADGNFYGTTEAGGGSYGSIFRFRPAAGAAPAQFATLVKFNGATASGLLPAGDSPQAALVDGGDGYLYGTTVDGGAAGYGTVFRMALADNSVQTLAQFTRSGGATPGANPVAGLTPVRNASGVATLFYGVASNGRMSAGGSGSDGVLFSITPAGTYTALKDFISATHGSLPKGTMLLHNNLLYGTTSSGGPVSNGTIFRYDPATGNLGIPFNFGSGSNTGSSAQGALMLAPDGWIYGTTSTNKSGTPQQHGTVFRLHPADDSVQQVTAFTGTYYPGETVTGPAGNGPRTGALCLGPDNALYGTTNSLGPGFGSIFKLSTPDPNPLYSAWKTANFTTVPFNGDNADPDGDGIANLMEYMTATNPNVRNAPATEAPVIATIGDLFFGTRYFFFQFFQRSPMDAGFTLDAYSSTNLAAWDVLPKFETPISVSYTGPFNQADQGGFSLFGGFTPPLCRDGACRRFGRVPAPGAKVFVRLKAVRP
jgi:uncharacterized repeat protein (TIGR03803 family)